MAVLIGVRAVNFVKQEIKLNFNKIIIWCDSQIILHWINSPSEKEKSRFVRNRLHEIRKETYEFKYVPTKENPADLSTRGCSIKDLKDSKLW